jgi:hypothetical protein
VVGVQVRLPPLRGLRGRVPQQLAGLFGHQLADVDALNGPPRHGAAEEPGEEIVEGAGAEFPRPERVVDHAVLS